MSWVITTSYVPVDPDFSSVSLLLHGDGANNSTTITDSSASPKTMTVAGSAKISTTQSKFGGSSIAILANGDYITTPYTTAAFRWWDQPFTIEAWVYVNTFTGIDDNFKPTMVGNCTATSFINYWSFGPDRNARLNFSYYNGTTTVFVITGNNDIPATTWTHIAMVNLNSKIYLYVNGVRKQVATYTTTQDSESYPLTVGASNNVSFKGYIDELRITKGLTRYPGNFSPPTTAFPDVGSR